MGSNSLTLREPKEKAAFPVRETEATAEGKVSSNVGDAIRPRIRVEGSANTFELGGELSHLGVIIDGNRRYAKNNDIELEEAYARGAYKVYAVIRHVFEETMIREMSIYAISQENLLRESKELDAMLTIQKQTFDKWASDPFFKEKGIRIRFVGERSALPAEFLKSCEALEEMTAQNKDRTLNMLVAYAGRREISAAVKGILRDAISKGTDIKGMDVERLIAENLSVREPVDLIIRTAGGHRLSGFLPWQSHYAEIIAIDKLWPEVEMEDIDRAIIRFCEINKTKHGL
jgi:undecaprenyl diphosphate synthase/tritrans,polycis-undecaprenyl-diphosphate synthase [geranylgeranyl-diphosphate specific]